MSQGHRWDAATIISLVEKSWNCYSSNSLSLQNTNKKKLFAVEEKDHSIS